MRPTMLTLSFAFLACYIHASPREARAHTPEMTSSLAGGGTLQRADPFVDAVGGGSPPKSAVSDNAVSTPQGIGWHLGAKPISTVVAQGLRRRRHSDNSKTSGSGVDTEHVLSSVVRHRRHSSERGAAQRVRREWDDSVLSWIKRSNSDDRHKMSPPSSADYFRDLHSDNDVGNDHDSAPMINSADLNAASEISIGGVNGKRRWDDADLAWLKRYSGNVQDDEKVNDKRDWDDSVLGWIKRNGGRIPMEFGDGFPTLADRLPQRGDGNRLFQKKLSDYEKRLWDDHEMAWL